MPTPMGDVGTPARPLLYSYRVEPCCDGSCQRPVFYVMTGKVVCSFYTSEIEAQAEAERLQDARATPMEAS